MNRLSAVATALSYVAMTIAVAVVALVMVLPMVTGGDALTVLSGSMSPTIERGALVLLRPVDPTTIEPGDVITFRADQTGLQYITHRVVGTHQEAGRPSFTTKGDANDGVDTEPVDASAVVGEVWLSVPLLGAMSEIIRTPLGLLALAGVAVLATVTSHFLARGPDRRSSALSTPEPPAR